MQSLPTYLQSIYIRTYAAFGSRFVFVDLYFGVLLNVLCRDRCKVTMCNDMYSSFPLNVFIVVDCVFFVSNQNLYLPKLSSTWKILIPPWGQNERLAKQ